MSLDHTPLPLSFVALAVFATLAVGCGPSLPAGTHVLVAPASTLYRDAEMTQAAFQTGDAPTVFVLRGNPGASIPVKTDVLSDDHCYQGPAGLDGLELELFVPEAALLQVSATTARVQQGEYTIELLPGAWVEGDRLRVGDQALALPELAVDRRYRPKSWELSGSYLPLTVAATKALPLELGEELVSAEDEFSTPMAVFFEEGLYENGMARVTDGCVRVSWAAASSPFEDELGVSALFGSSGPTTRAQGPVYWSDGAPAGRTLQDIWFSPLEHAPEGKVCGLFGVNGAGRLASELAQEGPAHPTLTLCFDQDQVTELAPGPVFSAPLGSGGEDASPAEVVE
ncbi:MAG: hypothetical protein RBU37_07385 [Myxococcota bacterium]|jgi:hypothetical protein|nr:hypothetical protein [Myxococcota bacterium]